TSFSFSSRRRHTRFSRDCSSDVCSSDLVQSPPAPLAADLARIALDSSPRADMRAYRVDGELVRQLRFPDLEPGLRQLQVRYRFRSEERRVGKESPTRGAH